MEIDADNKDALFVYLDSLSAQGKHEKVIQKIDAFLKLFPGKIAVQLKKASIFRRMGFHEKALEIALAIKDESSENFELTNFLITNYILLGQFDKAQKLADSSCPISSQEKVQLVLAKANIDSAQFNISKAIKSLGLVKEFEQTSAINFNLGVLNLQELDLENALLELKKEAKLNVSRQYWAASVPGQLLVEGRINASSVKEYQDCLVKNGNPKELLAITAKYPKVTILAMRAMIDIKKYADNLSDSLRPGTKDGQSALPKRIVQYWDDEKISADVLELTNSWKIQNPTYGHDVFTSSDAVSFVEKYIGQNAKRAILKAKEQAQKADLFRLAYLYVNGGIYVDADNRCINSIDTIINSQHKYFGYQEHLGSIANDFMAAAPNLKFIELALERAIHSILSEYRGSIWLLTGPGCVTRNFCNWLAINPDNLERNLQEARIFDIHDMHQFMATCAHLTYKNTKRHWYNAEFKK